MTARAPGERYGALDAIRGLAALAIVGFHAYKDVVHDAPGGQGPLTTAAWALAWGVPVFFALSGCLLYLPFARAIAAGTPRPDALRFYVRRALRILPAYWAVLLVWGTLMRRDELWTGLAPVRFGLLLQVYDRHAVYDVLGQAWSLGLEVAFYALLPLAAAILADWWRRLDRLGWRPASRHFAALAALTGVALVIGHGLLPWLITSLGGDAAVAWFTPFGTAELFALGMALAVCAAHRDELAARLRAWQGPTAAVLRASVRTDALWLGLAAGGLALGLALEGRHVVPWGSTVGAGTAAVAFMAPAVLRPQRSRLARFLSGSPVLARLGALSYGLYLWHWPVQQALLEHGWRMPPTWAGWIGAWALVTVLALPVAWLSHVLVERPAIELARRLTSAWGTRSSAATTVPAP